MSIFKGHGSAVKNFKWTSAKADARIFNNKYLIISVNIPFACFLRHKLKPHEWNELCYWSEQGLEQEVEYFILVASIQTVTEFNARKTGEKLQ